MHHFAPSVLPAGFLGVDMFFVVSGFLIARLLTREIERSGTVSLGDFWAQARPASSPALATVTVVVLCVSAIKLSDAEIHNTRAEALGTLFYCANWVLIFTKSNYFTNLGRPSPFLHMWTLAVEEQFYIVRSARDVGGSPCRAPSSRSYRDNPCVSSARSRRPYGCACSYRRPATRHAPISAATHTPWVSSSASQRAYSRGPDDRGGCSPIGCGRVRQARPRRCSRSRRSFAMLVIIRDADDRTLALYRGGFLVFAVLTAFVVAIVVTMPTALIARCLRMPWLVAIGLRSYSLYLWHWPVRVFVTSSSGLSGVGLFAVRLVISAALAETSFRLVERPFRSGTVARRFRSRGAVAYFVALTIAAIVLVATVDAPRKLLPTSLAEIPTTKGNGKPNGSETKGPTTLHVELFGDSTAYMLAIGEVQHANELAVSLSGDAQVGCSVTQTDRVSEGLVIAYPKQCVGWQARWQADMRKDPHAHLALMTGAWELLDQETSTGVVRFGTNAWINLNTSALRSALDVLTADGRTVSLFEVPCYGTGDADIPLPERSDPRRIAALDRDLHRSRALDAEGPDRPLAKSRVSRRPSRREHPRRASLAPRRTAPQQRRSRRGLEVVVAAVTHHAMSARRASNGSVVARPRSVQAAGARPGGTSRGAGGARRWSEEWKRRVVGTW